MIATGHQPVYLPWLGLVHKISQADVFVSWDDVQMEDSGYENRTRIFGSGGEQWLTVPVHRGRALKIRELTIANEHDWQRKHWRAIEQGYKGARYWSEYEAQLRYLYETKWARLVDLNQQALTFLLAAYRVDVRVVKLSSLGLESTKAQLVLDACKKVGAWKYVFGAHGPDYAKAEPFRASGVEPFVQTYQARPYTQVSPGFAPNLWAFDALLNLGPEEARQVMLDGGRVGRME